MQSINLIPTPRLEATRTRRLVRRWVLACVTYTVVIALASVACRAMWEPAEPDLSPKLDHAQAQAERLRQKIESLTVKFDGMKDQLRVVRDISQHPDWSALLVLLSDQLGERVVLSRCSINPIKNLVKSPSSAMPPDAGVAGPTSIRPRKFVVRLTGLAQSSKEVSQLLLRIENTGLFSEVKLLNGNRAQYMSTTAIAFQIECALSGRGGQGQ